MCGPITHNVDILFGYIYISLPRPRLAVYGFEDGPRFDNMVKTAFTGFIISDVLSPNKACPACHRVIRRARREVTMGFAQPVDAVVCHSGNIRVSLANGIYVVRSPFRF